MIEQLIKLSQSIANDISAIQGAGGNTSVKNDNMIYVKASGTLLSEMTSESGWAKLNLQQWLSDFLNFTYTNEDNFVNININNTIYGGRASIETGLHALLPHRYVVHSHSVYANVFLCSDQTQQLIDYICGLEDVQVFVVPMCAPGLQLTKNLAQELQNIDKVKPIIVLLENHGIAISCDSLDEMTHLHNLLHNGVRDTFELQLFKSLSISETDLLAEHKYIEASNIFEGNKKIWVTNTKLPKVTRIFFDKPVVFFPDQVVYINNKLGTKIRLDTSIGGNEYIIYDLTRQQVQNTAEVLASVLYLYENIQTPRPLSNDLCEYIANMSGEKYRQSLGE